MPGVLLFWKHGIFHSLTNSKLQRGLGWNLDRFAGRWITAFTGFSLGFYELSESGENKLTVRFHLARCEVPQRAQHRRLSRWVEQQWAEKDRLIDDLLRTAEREPAAVSAGALV